MTSRSRFNSLNDMANTLLEAIPFCHWLGLQVAHIDMNTAVTQFKLRKELIGNHVLGILHGGVIAAALDSVGGMMVMANALSRLKDPTYEEQIAKLSKVSTIDMRVDYLRPGKGLAFNASASILRSGNKVAVTRMELHNEENELLSVATGTYLMG